MTGEHCVLAIEGNRANEFLATPVGEEGLLAASMAMDLVQLSPRRDLAEMRSLQLYSEGGDQSGGSGLAGRQVLAEGFAV